MVDGIVLSLACVGLGVCVVIALRWRLRVGAMFDAQAWRQFWLHVRFEIRKDTYYRGLRGIGPYCLQCFECQRSHSRLVRYRGIDNCTTCKAEYQPAGDRIRFSMIVDGDEQTLRHWYPNTAADCVVVERTKPAPSEDKPAVKPRSRKRKKKSDDPTGLLFEPASSALHPPEPTRKRPSAHADL